MAAPTSPWGVGGGVGGSPYAGRAAAVAEVLMALFSRFDAIAEQCGVEKVKTIGDACPGCLWRKAGRG